MRFDNSDKRFAVKVSALFIILVVGIITQHFPPAINNAEQDVINIETKKTNPIVNFNVKKSLSSIL